MAIEANKDGDGEACFRSWLSDRSLWGAPHSTSTRRHYEPTDGEMMSAFGTKGTTDYD